MSLVQASRQYSTRISTLMLALLVAAVLQLCAVEAVFADISEQTPVMSELHDCCDDNPLSMVDAVSVCLECDSGELTIHHAFNAPVPGFMLLYITALLPQSSDSIADRQSGTDPEIISRFPEIYLVKGAFLE